MPGYFKKAMKKKKRHSGKKPHHSKKHHNSKGAHKRRGGAGCGSLRTRKQKNLTGGKTMRRR